MAFEAFRLNKPLPPRASAQPAQPAPYGGQQQHTDKLRSPAKRQRLQGGGGASPSGPAAAPPPGAAAATGAQQQQGLALEKMGDAPLRLVIVGHNPSQHAWDSGHFYSNPSNWMWRILRDTGLAPAAAIRGAEDDGLMPAVAGVGFTDVGSGTPGTDSSQFSSQDFAAWRPGFFGRMAAQTARASAAVQGCTCGLCGAPLVVAFSGKRQFQELFPEGPGGGRRGKKGAAAAAAAGESEAASGSQQPSQQQSQEQQNSQDEEQQRVPTLQSRRPGSIAVGRQWVLPSGWPLPLSTEVWVMTSTSGAAPMTREQRLAPWQALAERALREPWPRTCAARCGAGDAGG